jgi:DNA-binding beta-propeller fold protein YncE
LVGELKGLNQPLGVSVDSLGNIYVGNNGTDNVEVYDSNGVKIATIGDGIIKMPNEMAFDLSGNLYVVDSVDNQIKVYDPQGQNIRNISADTPISLAVSSYINSSGQEVGELFVAEMRLARISVFDLEGNYIRSIGRKVSTFGSFWHGRFVKLQSLAIDSLGRLHALDCYLNKVQILDALDGTFLGSYPSGEEPDHTKLFLDVVLKDPNTAVLTDSENKQLETFQY